MITRKLTAAAELIEERTGRYLRPTELEVSFDAWPCWKKPELALPVWPVRAVTAVEYIADGAAIRTAVAPDAYAWRPLESSAEVYFFTSWSAPVVSRDRRDPIVVTVDAGYDALDDASDDPEFACPARAIELLLLLAGHWLKNREATTSGTLAEVPFSAGELFRELRIFR